jgi:hypothetical protein
MFWVWFEDLVELSGIPCNRLTREMQYDHVGSIFFHSDAYTYNYLYALEQE